MATMIAGFVLLLRGASAACYMPNETAQISDYSPCYAFHSDDSFCCANHKTITTGYPNLHDNCLPNGLCQWIYQGQTQYWREGCSNASWPSEWCLTGICGDGDVSPAISPFATNTH